MVHFRVNMMGHKTVCNHREPGIVVYDMTGEPEIVVYDGAVAIFRCQHMHQIKQ
jgi:hypothetical protein